MEIDLDLNADKHHTMANGHHTMANRSCSHLLGLAHDFSRFRQDFCWSISYSVRSFLHDRISDYDGAS